MFYKLRDLFDDEFSVEEFSKMPREKMEILIEARVEHVQENAESQANKKFKKDMKAKR